MSRAENGAIVQCEIEVSSEKLGCWPAKGGGGKENGANAQVRLFWNWVKRGNERPGGCDFSGGGGRRKSQEGSVYKGSNLPPG